MTIFPILYTERLLLRKLGADDIPALVKLGNNRKISAYVRNIPSPYQEPDAVFRIGYVHKGFVAGSRYVFAITLREPEEFIGEISLHLDDGRKIAQLGYWLGEPYWKNGFTTEAIKKVLEFGFNKLTLDLVFASVEEENIASVRVLEKNGFEKKTVTGAVLQYSITREQYNTSLPG